MGVVTQSLTDRHWEGGTDITRWSHGGGMIGEYHPPAGDSLRVARRMNLSEIMGCLTRHGCVDITSGLNRERCDEYPTVIGGSGDVYRAVLDGGVVSVKCLQPNFILNKEGRKQLKRAARELCAWSRCNHPNVLSLLGLVAYRGQLAMVTPWMEYQDLRRHLSAGHSVDRPRLSIRICAGVEYLHSMNIAHGDLKGDNVLVSWDGEPRITDFGSSILQEYSLQFSNTTAGGGTIRWMAPEILSGDGKPTYAADVYSLGMTILETMTSSVPYDGIHEIAAFRSIVNHILPQRPQKSLPPGVEQADRLWLLLERCWARDPPNRPTATRVKDKIREIHSVYPSKGEMRGLIVDGVDDQRFTV